jgi:hypothetical protein
VSKFYTIFAQLGSLDLILPGRVMLMASTECSGWRVPGKAHGE